MEDDLKRKHESIRTILIENGNVEYGDCIIDEICNVVGIPPTTATMTEQEKLVRVKTLMFGLSFDHQRMSTSGQQYFGEICNLLDIKL